MPFFVADTIRSSSQVRRAEGFLGGSLLADRKRTFWTKTHWTDQSAMRSYMTEGAHRRAMPRLLEWCDEASVVHWSQDGDTGPDWREAADRMRSEGRPSKVRHPSPQHRNLTYSEPRISGGVAIKPRTIGKGVLRGSARSR